MVNGVPVWLRVGEGDEREVGAAATPEEVPALLRAVADELAARMSSPGEGAEPSQPRVR